jgi:hypothetical protein
MRAFIDSSPLVLGFFATSSPRRENGFAAVRDNSIALAGRMIDRAQAPPSDWRSALDRYLEGWSEADPDKIVAATAPDYRFDDPLVGQFSRQSLRDYFEQLLARFACAGASAAADFGFRFRGPTDAPPRPGQRDYYRETPRLGLTGVTSIAIGEHGITAEHVAYDLNLASDVLRRVT